MHKSSTVLKVLVAVFLILFCNPCIAQDEKKTPKNFIGVLGGIEWNTTSAAAGIDYERVITSKKQFSLGAKGVFIPRYNYGNAFISFGGDGSGHNGESISHVLVMAMGNFFTGKREDNTGFFFHAGFGVGYNSFTDLYGGTSGNQKITRNYTSSAVEIGLGVQFLIGKKVAIRLTASDMFGSFVGGFTPFKVAIGF